MIGILCSLVSFIYITFIKPHLKYDDPLDALGCHGVSGLNFSWIFCNREGEF